MINGFKHSVKPGVSKKQTSLRVAENVVLWEPGCNFDIVAECYRVCFR